MNVMLGAARKAGRSLIRDFGEVEQLQVSVKGPGNFVTAADQRAEEIIFTELSRARPGYSFLMEERGAIEGPDKTHRWIVDPLDGTTNFLHGIPLFAISIGLEREGELIAGLVYSPVANETFTAEKGKGAFLNDRRLRVAARSTLTESVISTGIPHLGRPSHKPFLEEVELVMGACAGVRRTGSAATDLAWTAAGRFDGYWERNLRPWDVAAGIVLMREAGGYVTDSVGKAPGGDPVDVVAGNGSIHTDLLRLLRRARAAALTGTGS